MPRLLLVVVVVAVLAVAGATRASSDFPSAIKSHLSASASPSCTVCHETNGGGFGTIDKAHGQAMQDALLVARDVDSLNAALDQLQADGTDSDGDGTTDIDELIAGEDPNVAGAAGGGGDALKYGFGCGASSTPLLVVLLTLLRRRRSAA